MLMQKVALGDVVAIVLEIGTFTGSNTADRDGFLKATKIYSATSFGEEVKPLAICRMILRHAKYPLRNDRYSTYSQNSAATSLTVYSHFATSWLCCNHIRELCG
jgi:hypothetical protein